MPEHIQVWISNIGYSELVGTEQCAMGPRRRGDDKTQARSNIAAMPCPPPMHMVTSA